MINLRPGDGNRKQEIESPALRREIEALALYFFKEFL